MSAQTNGGRWSIVGNTDPVVKIAKTYWRNTNAWLRNADMITGRWYPGLVRLPDERLLILGGELDGPPARTNGCEIYNPRSNSWTITGSFNLPTEIPPALLLFTGEVLKTWRYPELYNISSGSWRPAANMVQTRRGANYGDHADHEIVHLPDGRIMAVGILPVVTNANTRFCEFYNPSNNAWSLGPNSWRAMADLNRYVHYHNVTVLVPDGRVIATGGAGLTTSRDFAGDDSRIEAFQPPYLFRGVRPRMDGLSTTDLVLGGNLTLNVSLTAAITKLVLVSARATTHWNDGGPQRYLTLDFIQNGSEVTATVPNDAVRFLAGWYMLFAVVDDIPSVGRMVRVTPAPVAPLALPGVSITADDSTAAEPGANTARFRVTRTGITNAPLTVSYTTGGTAVNGADYNALSNFVVIPAGASSANITLTPRDDATAEGNESFQLSLFDTTGYHLGAATSAQATILDNEPDPPPPSLQLIKPAPGFYELTLSGSATRVFAIESSVSLTNWPPLTTLITATNGSARLTEATATNHLFFRARQE